jgi:glycosyltransferase involved in cell wall biosynthesis
MKLIVQIPALNEAETLPKVIRSVPRTIPGVDRVEILVVDDGSKDGTSDVASEHGADYVVRHLAKKGLPLVFQTGIDAALQLGADIIVNIDGDGQYRGEEIPTLIAPILNHKANMVVGDRQTSTLEHFTGLKKVLQRFGSYVVRWASDTDVPDTVSGFRAFDREAALRLFVTTDFSYTIESLIQAGKRRLTVAYVPVSSDPTRKSRLHRGNWDFVKRQASTILRTYATYEPLKSFTYLAAPWVIAGLLLLLRATYVYLGRNLGFAQGENVQSLTAGVGFLMLGFLIFAIGLVSDRIGGIRRLQEELLYRQRRADMLDATWRNTVEDQIQRLDEQIQRLDDPLVKARAATIAEPEREQRIR